MTERDTGGDAMDESGAIDALRSLGLSKYEADVFIALQKLTVSTARDVARITDVPRSQVYGTAESLEERGLIEVQQSNPIRYRTVGLDEAKVRLRREFEREQEQAFDFLESVQGSHSDSGEQREAIWTLHGRETVADRVGRLIRAADEYAVYGAEAAFLEEALVDALVEGARRDVEVTVVSADRTVVDEFEPTDVRTVKLPDQLTRESGDVGRIFVADGDTVLLSVLGATERPGNREETAIWSSETGFAAVLVRLVDGWFGSLLDL